MEAFRPVQFRSILIISRDFLIAVRLHQLLGGTPPPNPIETLRSFNDWKNLRFNFYNSIGFSSSNSSLDYAGDPELDSVSILNNVLGSSDIDADTVLNQNDNCIFAPNANQSDNNSNGIGDACDSSTTNLADLSVTMAESADPVQVNTSFDYIATIRNDGPNPANSVVFTNQLPANTVFVSVTPSQGVCSGTASINCNLGTILSLAAATVTIRVTPTVRGKLDNYANGNSEAVLDPNSLNNRSSASTTIFDPSQTFTISGTVADINGIGVSGVAVGFDGTQQGNTVTDASGNFSVSVASGGIYDLMPSKYGFAFTPPSRTVAYIAGNQALNFTAIDASASVSGRVTNANGYGISKAKVTITDAGGNIVAQALTSSFGYYVFGTVAVDQTYTVNVIQKQYQFTPRSIFVFEDISSLDFVAQP